MNPGAAPHKVNNLGQRISPLSLAFLSRVLVSLKHLAQGWVQGRCSETIVVTVILGLERQVLLMFSSEETEAQRFLNDLLRSHN